MKVQEVLCIGALFRTHVDKHMHIHALSVKWAYSFFGFAKVLDIAQWL